MEPRREEPFERWKTRGRRVLRSRKNRRFVCNAVYDSFGCACFVNKFVGISHREPPVSNFGKCQKFAGPRSVGDRSRPVLPRPTEITLSIERITRPRGEQSGTPVWPVQSRTNGGNRCIDTFERARNVGPYS